MSAPRDASTVIVARDSGAGIEVYLLRRSSRSPGFPDAYVFPGGTLDKTDYSPQARMRLSGEWRPAEPAFTYAAIRETFEECGLLFCVEPVEQDALRRARTRMLKGERSFSDTLIDLNVRLDARAVRYFSRWITPTVNPLRFDARFFVAKAPPGQVAEADELETYDGRWVSPAEALAQVERNEIQMIFPTIKHLERIGPFPTVDELLAFTETKKTIPVTPEVRPGPTFHLPPQIREHVVALGPRVSRLRAPNPSAMTLDGTNGYVVDGGNGAWIAIDPGPDIPEHVHAFVAAARDAGARYAAILVTHGHPDHYPAAAPLARATGAPVYAHPEAIFPHDRTLADGERITAGGATLTALDAPGHARDHLVYVLEGERALFTGDVILGRGTVVVAPPNGDMRAYQRTLHRLRDEYADASAIYGGHGPEVHDARAKIDEYIAHRERREAEILAILARGPATIPALVETIYHDVERRLWPAAARQILAYLVALGREGRVRAIPRNDPLTPDERALLDPDWRASVRASDTEVMRAELGFGTAPRNSSTTSSSSARGIEIAHYCHAPPKSSPG